MASNNSSSRRERSDSNTGGSSSSNIFRRSMSSGTSSLPLKRSRRDKSVKRSSRSSVGLTNKLKNKLSSLTNSSSHSIDEGSSQNSVPEDGDADNGDTDMLMVDNEEKLATTTVDKVIADTDTNNCNIAADTNIAKNDNGNDIQHDDNESIVLTQTDSDEQQYDLSATISGDAAAATLVGPLHKREIDDGGSTVVNLPTAAAAATTATAPTLTSSTHRKCTRRRRRRTNQKIRQHNNNQQHQTASAASALHHEYNVDHSCSTPLERLTRDIGNTLRQWNVHDGCDRHVSLGWIDQLSSSSTPALEDGKQQQVDSDDAQSLMSDVTEHNDHSTTKTSTADDVNNATTAANKEEEIVMSMDMCEQGFASRSRRIDVWMGDEDNNDDGHHCCNDVVSLLPNNKVSLKDTDVIITTAETSTTTTNQPQPQSPKPVSSRCIKYNQDGGAQCIRRKKIEFQTVGFSPEVSSDSSTSSTTEWKRRRYTIPLVLSLWDGPRIPLPATRTKSSEEEMGDTQHDFNDDDELDENNDIPLSLRYHPSPSSYALLGELGILSSCGTRRSFYDTDDTKGAVVTSKTVAFHNNSGSNKARRTLLQTGFGQDLSSLFNVGQHITLSLDVGGDSNNEKNAKDGGDDVQSLYNDMYAYIDEQIRLANEAYAVSQRERSLRSKKYQRRDTEKHVSSDGEEEVIDFEDNIQLQKQDSPFDDNSDTTNRMLDEESNSTYDEDEMQHKDEEESDSYEDDSSYIQDYICLNQHEMNNEVVSSLTSILHTALSLAASENDCNIPVFGIWGAYKGGSIDNSMDSGNNNHQVSKLVEDGQCAAPTWISPRDPQDRDETGYDDDGKLFLSSPIIVGTCETSTFRSTHRVYSISEQHNLPAHLSTLDGLAKVLLGNCPPNNKTQRVALTAARHCYYWNRHDGYTSNNKEEGQEWRNAGQRTGTGDNRSKLDVEVYREQCELQVLKSLERASMNPRGYFWRKASPLWGPSEGNPLLSLSASVSWGVIPSEGPSTNTFPTPLLQLPLKRRSLIAPSPAELFEMDSALQSAALNPVWVGVNVQSEVDPREPIFFASAQFDNNSPCATLSANTRCVLAALIRCGSLGLDTLPGHLTKTDVLFNFSPKVHDVSSSGEPIVEEIPATETKLRNALRKANIGSVTERLVNALDWRDAVISSSAADFRIESISYPEPPTDVSNLYNTATSNMSTPSKGKAAPPGRLLSLLFAHMARLRTPPAMMKLWLSFVEDLRTRWDLNESLPNLGSVPGLDIYHGDMRQHPSNLSLNQADRKGLGHRADLAAFVNSSEPEPSREHCLVNQKLQVFNICIECKVSADRMWEKKIKEENNDVVTSDDMSSEEDEDFFDAPSEEYVSFDQDDHNVEEMLKRRATTLYHSPTRGHSRVGARCPVPTAMPLIESKDQVYAPYLQRMMPMTDEEEGKQKRLFGVDGENGEVHLPIQERIKIMQHLQKPKLISDMASFKAANRGAVFEDFVRWYGNPENPLGDEISGESLRRNAEIRSKLSPQQAKALALNEASEAISLLMNLRAFWEDSWDESEAEAAFEQDPLFDPYTTVEMLLHSFETIHPALLTNQVLAVNLCNAKFVLTAASKQAVQVKILAEGLHNLNVAIDLALESLAKDASKEVAPPNTTDENSTPLTYVTTETISKCEEACNQIGEFEITLSRSLALLEKLHGNFSLVNSLLQCCTDANFVLVKDPKDRDAFLGVIRSGQMANTTIDPSSFFPDACMREYVMSNNNRMNPCHLNARLMSSTRGVASSFNGSLLLALSQSQQE